MEEKTINLLKYIGIGILSVALLTGIIILIIKIVNKSNKCNPSCTVCGKSDGCGGTCQSGYCTNGTCQAGKCVQCTPTCDGKCDIPDGCGGTCSCTNGTCQEGKCVQCTKAGDDMFVTSTCLPCCDNLKPYLVRTKSTGSDQCSFHCYDSNDPSMPKYTDGTGVGNLCEKSPVNYNPCEVSPSSCTQDGGDMYATGTCTKCCTGLNTYQVINNLKNCSYYCYGEKSTPNYDGGLPNGSVGTLCIKSPVQSPCK